jgi:dephospho-CoA kinase
MKIIGLTGGIGSGKTTISKEFKNFGIPVYYADDEAKSLVNRSKVIRRKLTELFGKSAYKNDALNRDFIRKKIFEDDDLRLKMNSIVHPKVKSHFKRWLKKQSALYIIKEAAIIYEIGQQDTYDKIIVVTANEKDRISRIQERDGLSKDQITRIITKQWADKKKVEFADYVIINNDLESAKSQALNIHNKLLEFSKSD